MVQKISNYDDLIDSRDVIARIAELEADDDRLEEETELKALRRLEEQGEAALDWQYGETLIRDSYFEAHARELAEDVGAIDDDARWPATCIDWKQAADELRMDYFSVDFDGVTYWTR